MAIKINNKRVVARIGMGFAGLALLAGYTVVALNRAPITKADAINNTDFVITVDTTKTGSSSNTQFTIPTVGTGYSYAVDCTNDGVPETTGQTGNYTCNFASAGMHRVRISGTFPRIFFNNTGDKLKLISIDQWGTNAWVSMDRAFSGAENMDLVATDVPNLRNTTNINAMFRGARSLKGETANWNWDVARIANMSSVFTGAQQFNKDLGSWDVANATNMGNMFAGATAFNNGGSDSIKNWNTGKLVFADSMFADAKAFNQPIGSWNMTSATSLRRMMAGASAFNQSLAGWRLNSLVYVASNPYSGAANMLDNTALSIENYDSTLEAWDSYSLRSPVTLGAAGLKYCRAETYRDHLTKTVANGGIGWVIQGDNKECPVRSLTFDTQGGSVVPTQNVAYGAHVIEPSSPTRVGHTFDGWYTTSTYVARWNFATDTMPNSDTILYAKWNPNAYKVQYNANTGTGMTPDTIGAFGQTVQIADSSFTKPGYTFTGWNTQADGNGTRYNPGSNYILPDSDLTLYAQWVDDIAPSRPAAAPDMVPSSDFGDSDSDNLTSDPSPLFTVVCTEAGSTITLYIDGVASGTVNCVEPGQTTVEPTGVIADGVHTIAYTEKDANNNESPKSPELSINIDTQAPSEPTININDIASDNIINLQESTQQQTITGKVVGGRENDSVNVKVNGVDYETTLKADGTFSVDVAGSDLVADPDSTIDTYVLVTDEAGNVTLKTITKQYSVDTTVPTGTATDAATADGSPALTGTVDDPAAKIEVTVNGKTYPAINKGNGTWELVAGMIAPQLTPGDYPVSVRITDRAGNVHTAAAALKIQGTVAPGAPSTPSPAVPSTPDASSSTEAAKPSGIFGLADTGTSLWILAVAGVGSVVGGGWLIWRKKRG